MSSRILNSKEAWKYLGISRNTFLARFKEGKIKPVNYNPALKQQHKPLWSTDDLDRLKNPQSETTT